jgi:U2 small nuclear ribonucleoprotein B''
MATTTASAKTAAGTTGSTTKIPSYAPNQTYGTSSHCQGIHTDWIHSLYLTNLPSSKIQKQDLRLSLYTLFSTYGPVLDVVALRTQKMRGQAHIVYRDVQTATQAMRALQGFEFFGLSMVCADSPIKHPCLHFTEYE